MHKDRHQRLFFVGLLLSSSSLISLFAACIWQLERVNSQALQQTAHALALAQLQTFVSAATIRQPSTLLPVVREAQGLAIKTLSFEVIPLSQALDGFADEARSALWADPTLAYYYIRQPDTLRYAAIAPSADTEAAPSLLVLQVNLAALRAQAPTRYGDFLLIFTLVAILFSYGVYLIWSKP